MSYPYFVFLCAAVSSQADPFHSAYPHPPQYWASGLPTQPGQQQQYHAPSQQQPHGCVFATSWNVDQMSKTTVGHPSSVEDPPAY
jgi:hypothetical protein